MADNDILRLASEANAARNAYDSAICKSLTGIIYGRRLIQAVDALTAAIAEQAAQQPTVTRERGLYEDLTIRDRSRSKAQSRLIGGMPRYRR